jgi:hypothetical protein
MSACIATTSYLRSSFDEKIRRRVKERQYGYFGRKVKMGGGRFQGTGQGRTIGVCIDDLTDREGV